MDVTQWHQHAMSGFLTEEGCTTGQSLTQQQHRSQGFAACLLMWGFEYPSAACMAAERAWLLSKALPFTVLPVKARSVPLSKAMCLVLASTLDASSSRWACVSGVTL